MELELGASPKPLSSDELLAVAPICAAFCSNAVADMWGEGGGGARGRRSRGPEKSGDPPLCERQSEMGSAEEDDGPAEESGGAAPLSFLDMAAPIKSENEVLWVALAAAEASRLAKGLALGPPAPLPLPLPFPAATTGNRGRLCCMSAARFADSGSVKTKDRHQRQERAGDRGKD